MMLAPLGTIKKDIDKIEVIPGGYVRFISVMGTDLDIVNDARQSYDVEHRELTEDDAGLINYLVKHRHGTPTEGVEFKFQIKAPLPVAREWMRHRWSSFSEISGRYVKQRLGFYKPAPDAIRTQVGSPGQYAYEEIEDQNVQKEVAELFNTSYNRSYADYEKLIELGVAKELARNVLAQGMFTKFMYKTNARGLMNFMSLRNDKRAMFEIKKYAEAIEKIFAKQLPLTYRAFINNGRIAP
jgi:thymidylate synthase (FAD)